MKSLLLAILISAVTGDGGEHNRDNFYSDHSDLVPGQDWGFDVKSGGCNAWLDKYTGCSGKSQSPIALPFKPDRVVQGVEGRTKNFEDTHELLAVVDGRGFEAFFRHDNSLIHSGIYTREKVRYIVYKFRWLFSKDSRSGSEHSLGGRHFPSEIQVFSFDSKFKTPEEAAKRNGILVTSILYKLSKEDNPVLQSLIEAAVPLRGKDAYFLQARFNELKEIFESDSYYFYSGSLSSPPCTENVLWAVSTNILGISERQLDVLRSITSSTGKLDCEARRPIQPVNHRKVTLVVRGDNYEYDHHDDDHDDADYRPHSPRTLSHESFQRPAVHFGASLDSGFHGGFLGGHSSSIHGGLSGSIHGGHFGLRGDVGHFDGHFGGHKRHGRFYRRGLESVAPRRVVHVDDRSFHRRTPVPVRHMDFDDYDVVSGNDYRRREVFIPRDYVRREFAPRFHGRRHSRPVYDRYEDPRYGVY